MTTDRAIDRQYPEHIRPEHAAEYAELGHDDKRALTPETLARWAGDLLPDDYTLAEIVSLERKRQTNLRTIRQSAELTDMEWRLWRYLARHAGRVRTFPQLAHHLFGTPDRPVTPRMLRQVDGYDSVYVVAIRRYVGNLRRKLEVDPLRPQHFATVRGVGYAFYDRPPSLDDGVNYDRRTAQFSRLRVDMLALLNPSALSDGGEQPDEYLDADVVDAVSVTEDGDVRTTNGIRPGPEHDHLMAQRRRNRRADTAVSNDDTLD